MKNKQNKNIGLQYKGEGDLPKVVFKGYGYYADHYEKEFKRYKAPSRIVKDEVLREKLANLPLNSEITSDLYGLIAILLIHVYSLEATTIRADKNDGPN